MFQRLFGRERNANRAITEALYAQIVAAARQTVFYSDWNVPDTPLGRFEMLSLHMFLFQHRLRGEEGVAQEVAQVLIDEFFLDVEHSLRELGVGDVGVPKRMKKLAKMFYGRTAAYDDALERGDGGSDIVDDANTFVAENPSRLATRNIALEDVQIGAADRRPGDPDDRVGGRGDLRGWAFFQGFSPRALIDESFHCWHSVSDEGAAT